MLPSLPTSGYCALVCNPQKPLATTFLLQVSATVVILKPRGEAAAVTCSSSVTKGTRSSPGASDGWQDLNWRVGPGQLLELCLSSEAWLKAIKCNFPHLTGLLTTRGSQLSHQSNLLKPTFDEEELVQPCRCHQAFQKKETFSFLFI